MARERTLLEYITPNPDVFTSRIFIPQVEENNLDLKPVLINIILNSLQFGGTPSEDPNSHIRKFLRLTNTIKFNGASTNAIRLKLFPFSVTEKDNDWLNSLPRGSITTWDQLAHQILTQYFSPALSSKMMEHIATFTQYEQESFYEAWERFQDLL
ncbi:Retrotransposon gag domain [Sesbania bispinosa]|nr:Retrotransposon gag domain [Sesbania bispinosa]